MPNLDAMLNLPVPEASLSETDLPQVSARLSVWMWLSTYVGLACWSFLRVPIPAVNEPHYLTKAKHFWDPAWCAGDVFLESSNPHFVYYLVIGWMTQFFSLHVVAVICRLLGLLVVSWGWTIWVSSFSSKPLTQLTTLVTFLLIHAAGNWSGEWLVGGGESKVFAYGFLLAAIGSFGASGPQGLTAQKRIISAALNAGLAVSFHPIVGLWGIIAAVGATLLELTFDRQTNRFTNTNLRTWIFAGCVCVVAALPGLIPAFQTLGGTAPDVQLKANLLQVGSRLSHHLDPMTFPKSAYRFYAMLILLWLVMQKRSGHEADTDKLWWRALVWSSIVIAVAGVVIAWGPRPLSEMAGYTWRVALLKFYPFRLADIMVPLAVSLTCGTLWADQIRSGKRIVSTIALALLFAFSIWLPGPDQNPSGLDAARDERFIAACRWINEHTEPDALVYSINEQFGVRWYSERAEYVNFKDCPQDAENLVEWNNRLWVIHRWKRASLADGTVNGDDLVNLHQTSGIDYLIVGRFGPVAANPVYRNQAFAVYSLTGGD